jgi:hypothetical protein
VKEILAGVYHWAAVHPRIHIEVSSYWLDASGVLIDPLVPPDVGLEWFQSRSTPPRAILLSNRHHYRDSARFSEAFGCSVHCNQAGLHEFARGESIVGFAAGELLPGNAIACEVGAICADETALYLPELRAMVLADAVVRGGRQGQSGALSFVPDSLMDDPQCTKEGLLAACTRLLAAHDFHHLLLAHGGPVIGDGGAQLQAFVESGGRTAFELDDFEEPGAGG